MSNTWVVLSPANWLYLCLRWIGYMCWKFCFSFGWCSITEDANWNVSSLRRMSCSSIEGIKVSRDRSTWVCTPTSGDLDVGITLSTTAYTLKRCKESVPLSVVLYEGRMFLSQLSPTSWYFVSPPFAHASLIWSRFSLRVDSQVASFLCRVCGCTARPKVDRHCMSFFYY